jgi:hypothetical protein
MKNQIDNAFADLNAKMEANQLAWFKAACEATVAYYSSDERAATLAALRQTPRAEAEAIRDADKAKLQRLAGGKTWIEAVWLTHRSPEAQEKLIAKNVAGLIAKRDATIIKALTKAGITSLPEFTLTETSDGYEGTFWIDGHRVTIRTILAGGYNIQCLHQRTLVKVA